MSGLPPNYQNPPPPPPLIPSSAQVSVLRVTQDLALPPYPNNTSVAIRYQGTWKGWDRAVNKYGPISTLKTIQLKDMGEGSLLGQVHWAVYDMDDSGNDELGTPIKEDTEDIIGLVDDATGSVSLVETDETGVYTGRIHALTGALWLNQCQSGSVSGPVVANLRLRKVSNTTDIDPQWVPKP